MAGPGHNPTAPQPIPNNDAPIISFESMILFCGIEKLFANKGLFLKKDKKGILIKIPPAMTKTKDGSQLPNKFKKPKTFSGFVILEVVNPIPNMIPLISEITLFKKNFPLPLPL
jgi:hypothetical protein